MNWRVLIIGSLVLAGVLIGLIQWFSAPPELRPKTRIWIEFHDPAPATPERVSRKI